MSSPVKQVQSSILVSELTVLFHNYGFRHLLAVDENNTPQGVVSISDVIKSQGLEHYFHFRQVDKSYNAKIPDEYGNSQIVKAIYHRIGTEFRFRNDS
jgi:signal-transduction protein with cAMP-binding, CBS, and nucleotidyltransferase domain